mgnify:FL=1
MDPMPSHVEEPMPYVNTLDLVAAARGKGYAVPAINIVDPLTIRAVVEG